MSDIFLPEGRLLNTPENCRLCASAAGLRKAMERQIILEGSALMAKPDLTLQVAVGPFMGEIPREETAAGIAEGYTRDIAVLSRVGKTICFVVDRLEERDGALVPILSRRRAQERAKVWLEGLAPGTVLPVTVTHLEPFGAFVDAGCGVSSLICVERISISRIPHPSHRFQVGASDPPGAAGHLGGERPELLCRHDRAGDCPQRAGLRDFCGADPQSVRAGGAAGGYL